jgi:hypothetical protein
MEGGVGVQFHAVFISVTNAVNGQLHTSPHLLTTLKMDVEVHPKLRYYIPIYNALFQENKSSSTTL